MSGHLFECMAAAVPRQRDPGAQALGQADGGIKADSSSDCMSFVHQ